MRSSKTGKRLKRRRKNVQPSTRPVTVMVFDPQKYPASQTQKAARFVEQMRSIYVGLRYDSVGDLPHICTSIARANQLGVQAGAVFHEDLSADSDRILAIAVFFARRIGQLYWSTTSNIPASVQNFIDVRASLCGASLDLLDEGQDGDVRSLIVQSGLLLEHSIKTTLIGAEWVEEPEDPDDYPLLVRPRLQKLIARRGEWYVPIEEGGYGLVDAYEHPTLKDLALFRE